MKVKIKVRLGVSQPLKIASWSFDTNQTMNRHVHLGSLVWSEVFTPELLIAVFSALLNLLSKGRTDLEI